ncbi:unnamed protein product, partial [Ectocarpus sp. 12 AP-2014]
MRSMLRPRHAMIGFDAMRDSALGGSGRGKDSEADRLYLRAIEIGEKTLGPDHL